MANKGLATKSTSNQPNSMEAWFAHLKAFVTSMASNMATQMKPITPMPGDSSA